MNKIIASILIVAASSSTADILSVHCPIGCPSNPQDNDLIFGHVYALSNNPETKFADWVAYEVNVLNFGDSPGRNWKVEPLLAENETLEESDYKDAHSSALQADRGHQAPLASFSGSHYWSELNHLSNITPQHKDLNQGPWKDLEDAVRNAVEFRKPLYVITGPLYEDTMPQLPQADEPHKVPSGYFKVIYDLNRGAVAFIMKQSAGRHDDYCTKQKTVAQIQDKVAFLLPTLTESSEIKARLGCNS